jgi:hypothetical protein
MREMEIGLDVAALAIKRSFAVGALLERLALLEQRLRRFLIRPEVGGVYFFFDCG